MTDDHAMLASVAVSTGVAVLLVAVAWTTPSVEPTGVPDRLLAGLVRLQTHTTSDPTVASAGPASRSIGPEGCRVRPRIRSLELTDLAGTLHPQSFRELEHQVRRRGCGRRHPQHLRGRIGLDGHLQAVVEATDCMKEAVVAAGIPAGTEIHIEARWKLRTQSRAGTRSPVKSRTAIRTEPETPVTKFKTPSSTNEGRSIGVIRTSNPPD